MKIHLENSQILPKSIHINKLKKNHFLVGLLHPLKQLKSDSLQPHGCQKKKKSLCQAAVSMEFSSQEYWSALPFPSPGESS